MGTPTRRVLARAIAAHLRPIEHAFDAPAHPARRLRLRRPDRLQALEHERGVARLHPKPRPRCRADTVRRRRHTCWAASLSPPGAPSAVPSFVPCPASVPLIAPMIVLRTMAKDGNV